MICSLFSNSKSPITVSSLHELRMHVKVLLHVIKNSTMWNVESVNEELNRFESECSVWVSFLEWRAYNKLSIQISHNIS